MSIYDLNAYEVLQTEVKGDTSEAQEKRSESAPYGK